MNYYDQPEDMDMNAGPRPEWETLNFEYPTPFAQVPHSLPLQPGTPYNGSPSVAEYQNGFQYHVDMRIANPEDQGNPGLEAMVQQPSTANLPINLQHLVDAYTSSYDDNALPNSTRMEHAKALILALLQHYYPESQGYIVQPSSLGPIAKHGMNFLLKADDGSDPDFNLLPPKKDPKRGKKKKPTKKQLESQEQAEFARQFRHWYPRTLATKWHLIQPEDIAGFEVLKKSAVADAGEDGHRPYTYLAIMIDGLDTLPSFAATNHVHPSDILTDVLCRSQKIRFGYGILLFGTRLEFYNFDNGEETKINNTDSEEYVEGTVSIDEPSVALAASVNEKDMVVDLKTMGLQMIDEAFKEIGKRNVVYLDEGAGVENGQDVGAQVQPSEVVMSDVGNQVSGDM
jgi:hypothetical protein